MSKASLCYSRALLIAAGENSDKLESLASDLDTAAAVLADPRISEYFNAPQVTDLEKEQLVDKAFEGDILITNFLKPVVRGGKIRELKNMAESFRSILSETAGVATAKIESATPLPADQIEELSAALRKFTGKKITVETTENKDLIGGVKIHLGDEVIDFSLARKLGNLAKTLS